MNYFYSFITLAFVALSSAFSQFKTAQITNVDFIYNGKQIVIDYDLSNSNASDLYFIRCEVFDAGNRPISAKSLTGDIQHIRGGEHKRIFWNFSQDGYSRDENIYFKILAVKIPNIQFGKYALQSTLFPGLGSYKLTGNKFNLMMGGIGYGCLAASIGFAVSSGSNYNDYKKQPSPGTYDKYVSQKKTALYLAGAGIATWLINYAILGQQVKQIKNGAVSSKAFGEEHTVITASSRIKSLYTKAPSQPPLLALAENSLIFTDDNKNNRIDANESAAIQFRIENQGKGEAINLSAQISRSDTVKGLNSDRQIFIGNLSKGMGKDITIPIKGTMDLTTGKAEIKILIKKANGFDADPIEMSVPTQSFIAPKIVIADYLFSTETGGIAKPGIPINLKAIVQNIGQGQAQNVKVSFDIPANVFKTEDIKEYIVGNLKPGESKVINFDFFANKQYAYASVPVKATVYESYGRYAENKTMEVSLNVQLAKTQMDILSDQVGKVDIQMATLVSDVDKNIPAVSGKNVNRYALIIGNEDYTSYQTELKSESNVPFAKADAKVFAEYCEKTLMIPKDNITLMTDVIGSKMKFAIDKISKIIEYSEGSAEVIVFYAGHGFPDEATKEAYLMPVDITGSNVTEGIRLTDLYDKLTAHPSKRITVFLDACFSGGGRKQSLLAARGIKIVPKGVQLKGNTIVFSASSGDQLSLPYEEKQHGMFTYYLLKKIQDTRGDVTYKELADYIKQQVQLQSIKVNSKDQNPEVLIGPVAKDVWEDWKLR